MAYFVGLFLMLGLVLWALPPDRGAATKMAPAERTAAAPAAPAAPAAVETRPTSAAAAPAEPAVPTAVIPAAAAVAAAAAPAAATVAVPVREPGADYDAARWSPLHFRPAIDTATNEQCLECHREVLEPSVRTASPAGLPAAVTLAWYQTLDTYAGPQDTFHRRHLVSGMAQDLMDLQCTFCHRGSDPREEAPVPPTLTDAGFTLRKSVNPETSCLACHGRFPWEHMEGLAGPWEHERETYEPEPGTNGCLACHNSEAGFRSVRHRVSYLKAEAIEAAAETNADTCYGCHGGRSWYRISYPYPRHPWPDMPEETPEWAKGRPAASDPRYALPKE
ncbi:hypothetical protein [Azospirillum halopraeferens]|uniref:hypothetical protein n=1 Tax=Azospirillum halopraeferens TaxID=34010 RepID=UPI00041B136C|nr:hypothetical protein [Azospirillum halopraeferens]